MTQQYKQFIIRLQKENVKTLYLSHEEYREKETRKLATQLFRDGFFPFVGHDIRKHGDETVRFAISIVDLVIIVAFDIETMKKAEQYNIPFVEFQRP